jgi:hypothetical protein
MAAQMTQTFIKYYINFDFETNRLYHSLSKHGLETPLKSLFYFFVCVYAVFCTVNEHIVFQYNERIIQ